MVGSERAFDLSEDWSDVVGFDCDDEHVGKGGDFLVGRGSFCSCFLGEAVARGFDRVTGENVFRFGATGAHESLCEGRRHLTRT
jgi:hypothetical protein